MRTFRPSARVRLQLRLDEGADTAPLEGKLEKDPPLGVSFADTPTGGNTGLAKEINETNASIRELTQRRAGISPTEFDLQISRLKTHRDQLQVRLGPDAEQKQPEGLTASAPDDRTLLGNILPRSLNITRNGIRNPDEFSVTLDWADAPIDPRVVRACFVAINLGVVEAADWQRGMAGETRDDGSLLSLVERADPSQVFRSTTEFVGFADTWEVHHNESGGSDLALTGRDVTAVLVDRDLQSGEEIDLTLPLERGIQELVDRAPSSRGLKVFFGSPGQITEGPVPAKSMPDARKARRGKRAKKVRSGDKLMSVWDHINDICTAVGVVPIFRGFELFLMEPRTFYSNQPSGKRTMLYGCNLLDLNFKRKLGGTKVPTIEVRSYDPEIGRTRWARAPSRANKDNSGILGITNPPKAVRANQVSPQGSAEDKIRTFNIKGVNDGKALERTAEAIFQQIGRQEIEGSFTTHDIDSFEREGEADLLSLLSGDPVELLIARDVDCKEDGPPTTTTAQELQEMSVPRRAEFLRGLGYGEDVALKLAEAQESVSFNTVFRVGDVSLDWSIEDGIAIDADFVNYIVVREDVDSAADKQPPDALTAELTEAAETAFARAFEEAASRQRTLTNDRARGRTTDDTYVQDSAAVATDRRQAARNFRRGK